VKIKQRTYVDEAKMVPVKPILEGKFTFGNQRRN
jgi:hypothetical protein